MNEMDYAPRVKGLRARIGLILVFLGALLFLLGAEPGLFGQDRSPVTGFIQILTFLVGLGFLCIGGYFSLSAHWNGFQKTISADIGVRLVATGFVIAVASGMADLLGFGSQIYPKIPYYGPWQEGGVLLGQAVIALGFLLMYPFHHSDREE
jgi:hypothetical protein